MAEQPTAKEAADPVQDGERAEDLSEGHLAAEADPVTASPSGEQEANKAAAAAAKPPSSAGKQAPTKGTAQNTRQRGQATATKPLAQPIEACGDKGQPMCPLQNWMEKNLEAAKDSEDFTKLATHLKKSATLVPDPSWNQGKASWASIADEGAKAAANGDMEGVSASCKSCHRAFRKRYKAEFRHRPLS